MRQSLLPINSFLAEPLVPWFIRWKISANAVTLLSLLFGLAGAFLFLGGSNSFMVLGAVGFLLANVLDECDGKVARQTGTSSRLGALLDTLADFFVHTAFFLTLGFGLARQFPHGPWAILGIIAAVGNVVSCILDISGLSGAPPKSAAPSQEQSGLLEWVTEWFRVDFSLLVLISALVHQMGWILWAGAVGVFLFWIPSTVLIVARGKGSA